MKKRITRTLTMLMAIVMLMGLLTTSAGAIAVFDYNYKTAPDYTEWHEEFRPTQDYKDWYNNREKPASQLNALGFVDPSTMNTKVTTYTARYLNTLRQYMPHVTDAQRTGVAAYDYGRSSLDAPTYGITGWTNVADAAQLVNAVNTLNAQIKPIRENTSICLAAKYAQMDPLAQAVTDQFDAYYKAGKVLSSSGTIASIAQYDSSRMTDEQITKFRSGTFISFTSWDSENEHGVNNAADATAWLSDSFRNDTVIRNAYLYRVTYYGENVFRNSTLETVIFPDVWLSDHSRCYSDPTIPARTQNGLIFGKEAVIIEANSFADCKNLKSVIVPCEPARLYLAPGVFKNCPNLTVYAPAGGTLESYCKANGIKFQAMSGAYLEPRVDEVGMMPLRVARTTVDDWGDTWCYYSRIPVAGYAPDAATMNNYANGIGVVMHSWKDISAEQMTLLRRDLNRYRSDDIRNSAAVFLPSHTGVALNFGWNRVPYGSFKFPAGTRTSQIGW